MKILQFFYTVVVSVLIVSYIFHTSIIAYIVQQYHYLNNEVNKEYPFFAFGNTIAKNIENMRIKIFEQQENTLLESEEEWLLTLQNPPIQDKLQDEVNEELKALFDFQEQDLQKLNNQHTNIPHSTDSFLQDNSAIDTGFAYPHKNIKIQNDMLYITPNTQFLLIGDSLMQGIGFTLVKALRMQSLKVKNIAKQSTGLTYPSFFDWPKETKNALKQNPGIGVIVICLGANDPWDMANGVRFKSDEWITIYNERIQKIFDIAKEHSALVVWYEVPPVKKKKLNDQITYLNTLYADAVKKNGGIFLRSNVISLDGHFSAYIKDETGKSQAVRTADGIHFTPYGSKLLTQSLMAKIIIENPVDTVANTHQHTTMHHQETPPLHKNMSHNSAQMHPFISKTTKQQSNHLNKNNEEIL